MEGLLDDFAKLTVLSTVATEATVQFDDAMDKLADDPHLKESLGLKDEELEQCEKTMRKIMDKAFDRKNDLKDEMLKSLKPSAAPETQKLKPSPEPDLKSFNSEAK